MPLYIKNNEADRLARELAATTGASLTDAIIEALRDRLAALREESRPDGTDEEIVGYEPGFGIQPSP
jgi:antitoxin VapB